MKQLTEEDLSAIRGVVKEEIAPVKAAVNRLEIAVDGLAQDTAAGFVEVHQRIGGLEYRIDGLEHRFDGLEQRFSGLEGQFEGLDHKFDRLENKVDGIARVQNSEVMRLDTHELQIMKIRKVLRTA